MSWIKAVIRVALRAYLAGCAMWLCTGLLIGFFMFIIETSRDITLDTINTVAIISFLAYGVYLAVRDEHDKQA